MRPSVTMTDALDGLAKLIGQSQIPSAQRSAAQFFITSAVERIYRAFDYDVAEVFASVTTDSNGEASLAALNIGPFPAISSINNGQQRFDANSPHEQYGKDQGSFSWSVRPEGDHWILTTSEPNATLTLSYYSAVPIGTTVGVPFSKMIIAKGSLIYWRQAEDPEADTDPEEDAFRAELSELVEQQNRLRPQRFAQGPRDRANRYLGR